MTLPNDPTIAMNETNTVAFISDGQVVQIDKTGAYYAAVLTSNDVTVIDVTDVENSDSIIRGSTYDPIKNTFTPPVL